MKRTCSILAAGILLFVSVQTAIGKPAQEKIEKPDVNTITVTGMLRLVGNEPFTRFSLRTEEGKSYFLEDVSREEWTEALGRKVTVTGILEVRTLKSADKTKTFTEHIILNAELVK